MYSVVITETAKAELRNAAYYISSTLGDLSASLRLIDTANNKLSSLSDFPQRNPVVKDIFLSLNGIRIQKINNYLAFYVINEDKKIVSVLRILHSRQNWIEILKNDIS